MKQLARSIAITALVAALLGACGEAPATPQGEPAAAAPTTAPTTAQAEPAATTAPTTAPAAAPTQGQADASGDKVTLNLWVFEGEDTFLPKFKEAYEKAHPNVTLEVTNIPEDQYVTKIDTALAANEPPDIGYIYERRWLKAGKFLPIDDMIAANKIDLKTYNQGVLRDSCTYEGKVYCLGSYTGAEVLFYNKAMFDAAGIAYPVADKAMTMDEYAALAAKLSKPNADIAKRVWGTSFAGAPYWLMDQRTEFSEDGRKVVVNSPDSVHLYQVLSQIVKDGSAPGDADRQTLGDQDLFTQQKVAMAVNDFSAGSEAAEVATLSYGVAPVPVLKGRQPWVPAWTDSFGVFGGSKHPDEAKEFIRYLTTDGQKLRASVGNAPLDYAIAEQTNWAGSSEPRKQFLQIVKLARPGVFVPGFWDAVTPLDDAFSQIVSDNKPVQAALDEAATQMQQKLDKNWQTWEQIK